MSTTWSILRAEAVAAARDSDVAARAYSELMPPPYVALKPFSPDRLGPPALGEAGLAVSEYEEAEELRPGLGRIGRRVLEQLAHLVAGRPHDLSRTLLADNPAWPPALAAARARLGAAPLVLALSLALSRTQDDKGRVRWTLFGASHAGASRTFWRSFSAEALFARTAGWMAGVAADDAAALRRAGLRVLCDEADLPGFAQPLGWRPGELPAVLLTFEPFARLPEPLQVACAEGRMAIVPSPPSLAFSEHPGYRKLARALPLARQIALLHLFPRSEASYALRIPHSGWLDEHRTGDERVDGHRMARTLVRNHRWQRVERDAAPEDDAFADQATVALFSCDPDVLGLYHKPMARNAQVWTADYEPILDGPRASREALARAAQAVRAGGRFGYRLFFPPMRAGLRDVFWHRPVVARLGTDGSFALAPEPLLGFATAEAEGAAPLELSPVLLDRPGHRDAARLSDGVPGRAGRATASNLRKILEFSELLGTPLAPSLAHALLDVARDTSLERWLAELPGRVSDHAAGTRAQAAARGALAPVPADGGAPRSRTFEQTRLRAFEEQLWRSIATLAEGEFRDKDNADVVSVNAGRTGGERASRLDRGGARGRDLDRLAAHLRRAHEERIAHHAMGGRALVADHRFRWETDFDFPWSQGWARNRQAPSERNVMVLIPGRDEREAVIMADHYDTAYMEDLYEPGRGGDRLRAAAQGADDNHSASAALLAAADVLLPLARAGELARSVWLVHLTGEEFPADCLGARALARALVRGDLAAEGPGGRRVDLSHVRVRGAFVLDMIGHNGERDRDVFQIAPGEGAGSARLALLAHLATERWNGSVPLWNRLPERRGRGRSARTTSGTAVPPIAAHLALRGEIRAEWEPRSALYNTDGQIFSDLGVPVVLFMENYDLRRSGYHDTDDTLKNIDLDYCAALAAIAIESVAEAAMAPSL